MAINNKDCGCSPYTACSPVTCTSYVAPECEAFNLGTSNTLDRTGLTDVTDVTLDVKKISAFREHLEFVNSPVGLSNIIGHTVIRLSTSFLNGIANIFRGRNIGTGAKLYKGSKIEDADTFQDFRTLKGSESILVDEGTDEITFSVDTTWLDGELPTVNYPVIDGESMGEGIPIYRGLEDKKIKIATLSSDSFIIAEVLDPVTNDPTGEIKINTPGGGSNSDDYYIDPTFTRPSNWLSKAELIDTIPTAKGTLNDPFKDFDEYLRRCVGEIGGSVGGEPYSRVNPKNPNKVLQVLSSFTTNKKLEVNDSVLHIKNGVTVFYNGPEEYAASSERLFDTMPRVSGKIARKIYYELRGEGNIVNVFHDGIISHKTNTTETTVALKSLLTITCIGEGLRFVEEAQSGTYTPMTMGDGSTPFLHAGLQAKGCTKNPTTPLIKITGQNLGYWAAAFTGSKLTIQTNTQTFIEISVAGSLTSNLDNLQYLVNANNFGYEKKLYPGLVGITADEIEMLGSKDVFFKPYANRNIFSSKEGSLLSIQNISTNIDKREEIAVNAIFSCKNGSTIACPTSFKEVGGGSSITYLESIGTGNLLQVNDGSQVSSSTYFAKGDNTNNINIIFTNSKNNNVQIISKNTPLLNINTEGTFSTIKNQTINSNIISCIDNTDAKIVKKLVIGAIYFNSTVGAIDVVV